MKYQLRPPLVILTGLFTQLQTRRGQVKLVRFSNKILHRRENKRKPEKKERKRCRASTGGKKKHSHGEQKPPLPISPLLLHPLPSSYSSFLFESVLLFGGSGYRFWCFRLVDLATTHSFVVIRAGTSI